MKNRLVAKSTLLASLCLLASGVAMATDSKSAMSAAAKAPDPALVKAVADPARTAKYVARDRFRHPAEELAFFGLEPKMTVVEVWPGSGYWTEISARISNRPATTLPP